MSRHIRFLALSILLISVNIVFSGRKFSSVRPFVASVHLGGPSQNKQWIYASNDSVNFTIPVVTSNDVLSTAEAKVDFLDYSNPMGVGYSISPTARTQTKTLTGGGEFTEFAFTMTTNGNDSKTGTVTFQFRLDSATGATIIAPQTVNVSVGVQSQTATGGGGCVNLCGRRNQSQTVIVTL